jgi:tRNA G18 (ribose-2'-O)-methylase SpoU
MELQPVGVHHPRIKQVQALQRNTTPNRYRLFVAEGLWAHNALLRAGTRIDTFFWCPEAAYSDEARSRWAEIAARAERAYQISTRTLERVSDRGGRPDGLLSIAQLPTWQPDELRFGGSALALVADGLEIPGNLGTLIRTLDACRADCLVLTNRRTRLSHPKVLRGSQGTSLTLPTIEFAEPDQAIEWLSAHSFDVLLADAAGARHYRSYPYPGRTALVVGSERYGISRPWYAPGFTRIAVPMLGAADSLNVAVCASVILYEARARKEGW